MDEPNTLERIASEFTDQWLRNLDDVTRVAPGQRLEARLSTAMSTTVCQYLVLLCQTYGLDPSMLADAAENAGAAERSPTTGGGP
jgi:hypothetical protein